jgi:hypothetical protein
MKAAIRKTVADTLHACMLNLSQIFSNAYEVKKMTIIDLWYTRKSLGSFTTPS